MAKAATDAEVRLAQLEEMTRDDDAASDAAVHPPYEFRGTRIA
jgi:hypothetical protein